MRNPISRGPSIPNEETTVLTPDAAAALPLIDGPPGPANTARPLDPEECRALVASPRWLAKVLRSGGCLLWVGALSCGYGRVYFTPGRTAQAHRVSWVAAAGHDVPAGMDLDHLCRRRACVEPTHLEPVTRRENLLRGATVPAQYVPVQVEALLHTLVDEPACAIHLLPWLADVRAGGVR